MQGGYSVAKQLDPRLRAQELEFIDKMQVCWRLPGYGMLHEPDVTKYSHHDQAQAEILKPHFRQLARTYINHLSKLGPRKVRALIDEGPVKLDRGKGAPYWSPRTDRAVTLAYGRLAKEAVSHDDLEEMVMSAGQARLPFVQTSYVRIDRSRKPVPRYVPYEGALISQGEQIAAKVRRIGAMPFAVNHLWAGVGNLLRTLMSSIDQRNTGTLDPAISAGSRPGVHVVAIDLAGFDTTVSYETLTAFRIYFLAPVLDYLVAIGAQSAREAALLLDCDAAFQRYQILVPPWNTSEVARLVDAMGQVRSGENLTSLKGTLINRCRLDAKLASLDPSATTETQMFNYGDDSLLVTNSGALVNEWAATPNFGGFVETVAPDATFLMRRIPWNHGYIGRMIGACVNRESHQEPAGVLSAAAAFATRRDLLRGHPAADQFLPLINRWQRNREWSLAVATANGADGVTLSHASAMTTLALRDSSSVDAEVDQLAALKAVGAPGAQRALDDVVDALHAQQRQVSWGQFSAAAAAMSLQDARREIKRRSYTIRHQ
jgi:hypothetical protein